MSTESITSYLVDLRQHPDFRAVQHSERQGHHLQVLATGCGADVPRLGTHIVDDGPLQPWDEKVGAFVDDRVFDTVQTVEDHSAAAAFDIVDGGLSKKDDGGDGEGVASDGVQSVGHDEIP